MVRFLATVATVAALLCAPKAARGFDWLGKIELDADGLDSSDPQLRLQAVQRLGRYDIVWTKKYLLEALRDQDRKLRAAAGRILARHRVAAAVPIVIRWLSSADKEDKIVAADILGELGAEEAVGPLVRSLGDLDSDVRHRSIIALGKIGGESVMVPLIGRLEDDKAEVRRAAVEQLMKLGDRRAVIPLVGLFDDSSLEVRVAAVTAVGRLGDRAAVPALLRLLRDPIVQVKVAAVTALGNLKASEATDTLIDFLDTGGNEFRAKVAYALGQIASGSGPEETREAAVGALVRALANGRLRAAAREALLSAGRASVPALVSHLRGRIAGDPTTAVLLLRDIGDRRATPVLINELDRGRISRELVLEALSATGDQRALVPLLGLLGEEDATVRLHAMRALRPMLEPGSRAADVLADRLADPNLDVQVLAAQYLGIIQARVAVERLQKIATSEDKLRLRAAAVRALGAIDDPRATPALLEVLRRGPAELHLPAANSLIYLKDSESIASLLELARDPASPSRAAVVRTLGGVLRDSRHEQARELLESLAADAKLTVSLAAIAALSSMADPASVEALSELAKSTSVDRKRAALEALGNLGDGGVTPLLVQNLKSTDDRLAAAAAWSLGKLGAKEAARPLYRATRRQGFATPINASAALALILPARKPAGEREAERVLALLHHKSRFVRVNAAHAAGRLGLAGARKPLSLRLREDASWLVRIAAARALSQLGGAEQTLREARAEESRQEVQAALDAALSAPFAPPARSDWRNFYFVDSTRGDDPVEQEAYFLATSDGLCTAFYTDARGEWAEERFPPGERGKDYYVEPAVHAQDF